MPSKNIGVVTDTGRRRERNEDSCLVDADMGLFVVSDGMGGHKGGEVASTMAVRTIGEAVRNGRSLRQAIVAAHRAIRNAGDRDPEIRGMGATAVVLQLQGNEYEIAWVGDSRAYLWDGALRRLTHDHSYIQQLIDAGAFTPAEAKHHPGGGIVTRALGMQDIPQIDVDTISGRLSDGSRLFLCSDGLTSELDDEEIADLLREDGTEQEMAERLVKTANERGGRDNITVVLVRPHSPSLFGKLKRNPITAAVGTILVAAMAAVTFWLLNR